MKKLSGLIIFLICASISFGQTPPPFTNNQSTSNAQTIFHYKGALKGDVSLMLPIMDTLNNPATRYVGSVTIRPQDTIASDMPPIYVSNGHWWYQIVGGGTGGGIDSVGLNNDSTLYLAYNEGLIIFSFPTLIVQLGAGEGIYFTETAGIRYINSTAGEGETHYITEDSLYWVTLDAQGNIIDSTSWQGTDGTSIAPSTDSVSNGTYYSTSLGVSNITSTTGSPAIYWTKIGTLVHASCYGVFTATSTGVTEISFTLPSSTGLFAASLIGAGSIAENAGTAVAPCYAYLIDSTTVKIRFIATFGSTGSYFFSLDYPN